MSEIPESVHIVTTNGLYKAWVYVKMNANR